MSNASLPMRLLRLRTVDTTLTDCGGAGAPSGSRWATRRSKWRGGSASRWKPYASRRRWRELGSGRARTPMRWPSPSASISYEAALSLPRSEVELGAVRARRVAPASRSRGSVRHDPPAHSSRPARRRSRARRLRVPCWPLSSSPGRWLAHPSRCPAGHTAPRAGRPRRASGRRGTRIRSEDNQYQELVNALYTCGVYRSP